MKKLAILFVTLLTALSATGVQQVRPVLFFFVAAPPEAKPAFRIQFEVLEFELRHDAEGGDYLWLHTRVIASDAPEFRANHEFEGSIAKADSLFAAFTAVPLKKERRIVFDVSRRDGQLLRGRLVTSQEPNQSSTAQRP